MCVAVARIILTLTTKMHAIALLSLAALSLASPSPRVRRQNGATALETNSTYIEQYWGQITPYIDNTENFFGVANVGMFSQDVVLSTRSNVLQVFPMAAKLNRLIF